VKPLQIISLFAFIIVTFLTIMHDYSHTNAVDDNPRLFQSELKRECWNKSSLVVGRDPDRWRLDAVGNTVCRKLTGCNGCLCHEYDHIVPYSKGGKTELSNCQILQSGVNRMKSNNEPSLEHMKQYSCNVKFTDRDLDVVEMALYGDIKKLNFSCRCKSIMEMTDAWKSLRKSKKMKEYDQMEACK
jgi:hypothetical protein